MIAKVGSYDTVDISPRWAMDFGVPVGTAVVGCCWLCHCVDLIVQVMSVSVSVHCLKYPKSQRE